MSSTQKPIDDQPCDSPTRCTVEPNRLISNYCITVFLIRLLRHSCFSLPVRGALDLIKRNDSWQTSNQHDVASRWTLVETTNEFRQLVGSVVGAGIRDATSELSVSFRNGMQLGDIHRWRDFNPRDGDTIIYGEVNLTPPPGLWHYG